MGRIKTTSGSASILLVLGTVLLLAGCENALQKFIIDDLYAYKMESAKLLPTNGSTTESFGMDVDIDGDYTIVGAPAADGYKGAAYIFSKSSDGTWNSGQRITASDGAAGDKFGYAVAISGEWAVVGAYGKNVSSLPSVGGSYIFHKETDGTWVQTQIVDIESLSGSNTGDYDNFGYSVDIDNSWIVIGARQDDLNEVSGNFNFGAAYILKLTGTTWNYNTRLDNGTSTLGFGFSVEIIGDILVIGAANEDIDGDDLNPLKQGSAYIYRFKTDGWEPSGIPTNRITSPSPTHLAHFGGNVALSTNYMVIGAPSWESVAGSASVFSRTNTDEWNSAEIQVLKPAQQKVEDLYGKTATDGSFILVGAPHADYYSPLSGAVFLYKIEENGTVTYKDVIAPEDISDIKGWGWSVAMDESSSIIGATDPYNSEDGAAYIFE